MTRQDKWEAKLASLTAPLVPLWEKGIMRIAGIDEAGRGPLAGPVVAACVIMPKEPLILGIDESKKLSETRRRELCAEILASALDFGIGIVDVETIEKINILESARLAFQRSLEALREVPQCVFTDAMKIYAKCPVISSVKADSRIYTVAAASIVAKETRDGIMREYDRIYPAYGFRKHKGYGTKAHREAIIREGPCPIHRRSFLKKLLSEQQEGKESPQGR